MKIKLLTARVTAAGAEDRGAVLDVESAEAVRMIEAGQAEPVRTKTAPEKATGRSKPEKAAR